MIDIDNMCKHYILYHENEIKWKETSPPPSLSPSFPHAHGNDGTHATLKAGRSVLSGGQMSYNN